MNEIFKLLELCYTEGIAFDVRYETIESPAIMVAFNYGLKAETTPDDTILLTYYSEQIVEVDLACKNGEAQGCLILFAILKYKIGKCQEERAKEYEEYKDL